VAPDKPRKVRVERDRERDETNNQTDGQIVWRRRSAHDHTDSIGIRKDTLDEATTWRSVLTEAAGPMASRTLSGHH
jgi:hypothetical protein